MTVPDGFGLPPRPSRVADLWWLLAHDERGRPRLGFGHYGLSLTAAVVAEALSQPAAATTDGWLVTDPVVGHVLDEFTGAAREGIVQSARTWLEWLTANEHPRTETDVTDRLIRAGWLMAAGKSRVPVDAVTSYAPISLLLGTIRGADPPGDPLRVLAGLTLHCGLDGLLVTHGEGVRRRLQQLVLALPTPLQGVLSAAEDAIQALATRHR